VTASAFGYTNASKVLKATDINNNKPIRDTLWMNVLTDQKIVMRNIYYKYDRWEILAESLKELDKLVELMKVNSKYNIQLGAHTDDKGTDIHNLELSQRRSKAVVDYIVSRGIVPSRIIGKGYGRSQPIHKCPPGTPCTPAQRRENKRIEINISGPSTAEVASPKENILKVKVPVKQPVNPEKTVVKGKSAFKYYLILASFTEKEKVGEFLRHAEADGLKITVLEDGKIIRVGIGYNSMDIDRRALGIFKDKYRNIWIMKA